MLLIDIADQRQSGTTDLALDDADVTALLELCGVEFDSPLEIKLRIRDARRWEDVGYFRPLDEALTCFRVVVYVLPYKRSLSEAARRVVNRTLVHNCVHIAQLRAQGLQAFEAQLEANEAEACAFTLKNRVTVLR